MVNYRKNKILLAGYGVPAEIGLIILLGLGFNINNLLLLTYPNDSRNSGLLNMASLRGISYITNPINDPVAINVIRKFEPDFLISLHYRSLIPLNILKIIKNSAFNLHPSLLPKYRGANSIPWALINGEKETGFSFHYMDEKYDTGAIIHQESVEIYDHDTAFSLFHRLIYKAMSSFEDVLFKVFHNYKGFQQSIEGSYYSRSIPYDGKINIEWSDDQVERFIRAMYFPPFDPALLILDKDIYQISSLDQYKKILFDNL